MFLIHGKSFARHLREIFEGKTKDRFGLPYHLPQSEEDLARQERLRLVQELVADATAAVIRHLGEDEAKLRFQAVFEKPLKGRQPDETVNAKRLAAYDAALTRGVSKDRAARRAAEDVTDFNSDAESVAKHIRGLARARDEKSARAAKARDEQDASALLWLARTETSYGLTDGILKPTDSDI